MSKSSKKYRSRAPWGLYTVLLTLVALIFSLGFIIGYAAGTPASACEETSTEVVETREVVQTVAEVEPLEVVQMVAEVEAEAPVEEPAPAYTDEELETLAIIIYQEAGSDACSDETRQMVGEVFLNRVKSPRYPNTFYEVATQKAQYGRLYWTDLEWPERASNPNEADAVARAYECAEALLTGEVERLLPEDAIYQAEFPQGTEVVAQTNGFYFCR